jgi:hypothetical protein
MDKIVSEKIVSENIVSEKIVINKIPRNQVRGQACTRKMRRRHLPGIRREPVVFRGGSVVLSL